MPVGMSWSVRRFWLLNKGRSFCTKPQRQWPSDEARVEKAVQEFLDSLPEDKKRELKIIEMEHKIRRANNEPVPSYLTVKQKKTMLLNMHTKEERLEYLYQLNRTESMQRDKQAFKEAEYREMGFYQDMKEGTFIHANTPEFSLSWYRGRMAQTFITGMPIVYDVGYHMDPVDNWKFIKALTLSFKHAKEHKQPANLIVSGLGNNKSLKEMLSLRPAITKMMVDFREEPYWAICPDRPIVYLSDEGPELTAVDGEKLHVMFCGARKPKLIPKAELRKFPFFNSLFARSNSAMLDFKAKILMDMSLEKDVEKVYLETIESGAFKHYMSKRKYTEFMQSIGKPPTKLDMFQ